MVNAPGETGATGVACRILRGASVASTLSRSKVFTCARAVTLQKKRTASAYFLNMDCSLVIVAGSTPKIKPLILPFLHGDWRVDFQILSGLSAAGGRRLNFERFWVPYPCGIQSASVSIPGGLPYAPFA